MGSESGLVEAGCIGPAENPSGAATRTASGPSRRRRVCAPLSGAEAWWRLTEGTALRSTRAGLLTWRAV